MEIIVNAHTIQLTQTEIVNEGEYNIQQCNFTFSEEYNGLTKIAIFSNLNNSFQTIITNGSCIIPAEILQQEGTLILGVYGYETDGETLIKRYSPTPACFKVDKGSYQLASEVEPPSPSIVEQLEEQINELSDEITTINNIIPTLATKSEIPTKTSQLTNDSNFAYTSDIPTKTSQLENNSGFIDKNVNDLTNYTKTSDLSTVATTGIYSDLNGTPDLSVYATTTQLGNETAARENADIGLQGQIDAITSSSDVKDIVGTYTELENYDTSTLGNDDIIKVLQDSTHNNAMTYYRWVITGSTGAWQYIGQEGPYYTKSEIDTTLTDYVTDTELSTELQPYVKNTDYATTSKGGVIKLDNDYATDITAGGKLRGQVKNYNTYGTASDNLFISKGTLENVITGKQLVNQTYVDNLVGDINTALDTINGEVI